MRGRVLGVVLGSLAWGGCHAYQRDPGYAVARLGEIVRHPLTPESLRWLVPAALVVLAIAGGAIALAVATRRR